MASSSNDSLSAAASGAGSLASLLVLSISRNRAEVSSQNLIYGKFPQMQEDFCEFLSQVSGGGLEAEKTFAILPSASFHEGQDS
jgi:hypothetical protein